MEIDEAANERMDILMPQLMKAAGVTGELKAADPMKWVGWQMLVRRRPKKLYWLNRFIISFLQTGVVIMTPVCFYITSEMFLTLYSSSRRIIVYFVEVHYGLYDFERSK